MYSHCLSAASIRFLSSRFLLTNSAVLTIGLLLSQTLSGFPRFASSSYDRRRCPLYCGGYTVSRTEYATFSSLSVHVQIYPQYHRSKFRLLTVFTFRWLTVTQRRRGFTFGHPIGLCLVCRSGEADPLDISPQLHTPPLPATHVRVATGLNTGRERYYPLTL